MSKLNSVTLVRRRRMLVVFVAAILTFVAAFVAQQPYLTRVFISAGAALGCVAGIGFIADILTEKRIGRDVQAVSDFIANDASPSVLRPKTGLSPRKIQQRPSYARRTRPRLSLPFCQACLQAPRRMCSVFRTAWK